MRAKVYKIKDGYEVVNHEGKLFRITVTEGGNSLKSCGTVGDKWRPTGKFMSSIPNHVKSLFFTLNRSQNPIMTASIATPGGIEVCGAIDGSPIGYIEPCKDGFRAVKTGGAEVVFGNVKAAKAFFSGEVEMDVSPKGEQGALF